MDLRTLEMKHDRRGTLVEAYKFPHDGQLFYVIATPNETRGNHYHLRKIERFLVIYGSATILAKNRDTNDMMRVEVSGLKPLLVEIHPNHTHSITATKEGAIFLVWVNEQYNKDDPDTYPEEI
jgi:UDP-2-acetamido-2,6-beta-L-arabino-hexul-4-ose reductase